MIIRPNRRSVRRTIAFAFFVSACACIGLLVTGPLAAGSSPQATLQQGATTAMDEPMRLEPPEVATFRQSVGGAIIPLVIELKAEPGVLRKVAAEREGQTMPIAELAAHAGSLVAAQDVFIAQLGARGVRALPREAHVRQLDGSTRHIKYRFTYLLNGFVAYVATADIPRLRAMPEVAYVSEATSPTYHLNNAIDYSLATDTDFDPTDRRTQVYGATQEFTPANPNDAAHPEAPKTETADGFEGQKMRVAVIDTGVDWRHPMFGGIGQTTPQPRVSGQPESAANNKKVIYYYALSSPGDITDDFGHGTHVASCAAGYAVDGNTAPRTGYGLGVNPPLGVGPTPGGVQLFGTAPQAQIMAYKVCGPANSCPGDIELAIEDAASPYTLVASGETGAQPVAKPIADVINLSLGDTSGDPAGSTSRASNNAALAGTIVVTSAGNSGPGLGTTGAPGTATLAIAVAANLDPGSLAAADVLQANQVPADTRLDNSAGPPPETGAESRSNLAQPEERQGIKLFPVAGGGAIPQGSMSAHYVYVEDPNSTPPEVRNRIALVRGGTGTFFNIVNAVAVQMPAAIIITDDRESLTALVVAGGIPVFNINNETTNYLINRISDTDADANNDGRDDAPVGSISQFPLRLSDSFSPESFPPSMAGFSSRGPNDHPNARFRTVKPDVTAPGVGILGAATVEGTPEETVGMASTTGYIKANGTSFASPITAGAIALVRQYVRNNLGLDETDSAEDQAKPNWRARRFDTVTVARALLMNSATNLRTAAGVPQGNGAASTASVNEMGAGLINVAGALQGKAIMVAPEELLTTPSEYTPQPTPTPSASPSPAPSPTPLTVLIPSVSFGPVPVIGVNGTVTRSREVIIRDVAAGAGSGVYTLTLQNNRNLDSPAFQVSFTDAQGAAINSVSVPSGGQASFFVQTVADGNAIITDPTEFQWYVTATSQSGQTLRMPFYYRAVQAVVPNIAAPEQQPIADTQAPSPTPTPSGCGTFDEGGDYTIRWSYPQPTGGPTPQAFRVQEATELNDLFFDNADEPLVNGDNSKWTGTDQWNSSVNPETGSLAYYVPDAADQDESITMVDAEVVPPGGATLSFDTTQDTEPDFDFAHVELTTDGTNFVTVATFSGFFAGTRHLDISGYAGHSIKVRFRMVSDLVVSAPGWWVENIRITSDNFRTIANVSPATTSLDISGRFNDTYFYRIAGLFDNPREGEPIVTGPYSNVRCVTVTGNVAPPPSAGTLQFSSPTYAVAENDGNATITVVREGGTAGTVSVNYATSDGSATAGPDYTATTGTLVFEPDEASKTFTVPITNDDTPEPDEKVNLTLSAPAGGASLGTQATAVLTIIDEQGPPTPGSLQFSASNYSQSESAGTVTVTVTRTGGSDGAVSVSYATSDGSAKANSDYTPTSGVLNFAAGEVTRTFTVALQDDPSVEEDEAFIVTLSNPGGGATLGTPASATVTILDTDRGGPAAQLLNISTRLRVQAGDKVGIGGFIVTGTGAKRVIVRGLGPSLTVNGQPVEGRLQDPAIELYDGNGILITSNDNWKNSPDRAEIESSGLAPSHDAEAAIARTVQPGAYTAVLYGTGGSQGIGLVEAYDRDRGGTSEMANISTRGFVDTGDNVLIGGFIAGARSGATNVIVRALGPSLTAKSVPDALQDPTVQLINANGQVVDSSDNWKTSGDQAEVTARGLAPQDDRESAAFETIPPGNYTVVVRGKGETTGVGLVEIYNVQ